MCNHLTGTISEMKIYSATLEEPGETVGKVYCDNCGEYFKLGYEPETMTLKDDCGRVVSEGVWTAEEILRREG